MVRNLKLGRNDEKRKMLGQFLPIQLFQIKWKLREITEQIWRNVWKKMTKRWRSKEIINFFLKKPSPLINQMLSICAFNSKICFELWTKLKVILRKFKYYLSNLSSYILKATKFCQISTVDLSYVVMVKSTTPPRSPRMSRLKSQIMKPTFLS